MQLDEVRQDTVLTVMQKRKSRVLCLPAQQGSAEVLPARAFFMCTHSFFKRARLEVRFTTTRGAMKPKG